MKTRLDFTYAMEYWRFGSTVRGFVTNRLIYKPYHNRLTHIRLFYGQRMVNLDDCP